MFNSDFLRKIQSIWASIAASFEKPAEVSQEERILSGWACLRRRSTKKGSFLDSNKKQWEEYIDSKSGEHFYWSSQSNDYSWDKPEIPKPKNTKEILNVGDKVIYRLVEGEAECVCSITRCRVDDSTGEDMYDLQDERFASRKAMWIPRTVLKRVPDSLEAASFRRYEAMWVSQIRRRRAADERKRKRMQQEKVFYGRFDRGLQELDSSIHKGKEPAWELLGIYKRTCYSHF